MKKSKESYRFRLEHIIDAIKNIELISKDLSRDEFVSDLTTSSAVCYQFLIIGEAISSLPTEITDKYKYSWYKPRSFRNFLAHEYFGVDLIMVFDTIHKDLPEFRKLITRMISDMQL
ncbi:MAG: hypothetical protein A2W93_02900 [Bacteroidetes bacterium GWF2_43_63]|nr:MAG: hypothetical protein A2W94_08900 [Bacteroidetes bacterium GWE2_42_42]OFY53615.1 MAG: hypothetical protein A2W93_02900 [Bacteroidetes bacterium GWF2_43_63]HBG71050.1 DUF86 domain-containing protein [Bacteroidales bacterium]HCB63628.1 DUF86 domain-containing protein [Bacteroidales bacterium]HCY24377.1 DUF86 domain-containing protein [Bacteroidales bacterium]